MVKRIDRDGVRDLVAGGAALIEVLPSEEYGVAHLPGAVNMPLKELTLERVAHLERQAPVIVYCNDTLWDMSPRAALRFEAFGFADVYDYVAGKDDWMAALLPTEGTHAHPPLAGDALTRDVPTCGFDDPIAAARETLAQARRCIVLGAGGVVMGELWPRDLRDAGDGTCGEHARPGPTTIRPNEDLAFLLERMSAADVADVIVTDPEGRLLGIIDYEHAAHFLHESHERDPHAAHQSG